MQAHLCRLALGYILMIMEGQGEGSCIAFCRGKCQQLFPGFAGAITTLGRGGSDLTATVIGAALGVEEVQVWKDVDGARPAMLPF